MKRNSEGIKPKTSICVSVTTLNRLKAHMKYGDTVNGMVDNLLDFYEEWKDLVFQINKGVDNGQKG